MRVNRKSTEPIHDRPVSPTETNPAVDYYNGANTGDEGFRRWKVQRLILRWSGFILFDTAICVLLIGLIDDGDYWYSGAAIVRLLSLSTIVIVGGLILRLLSRYVDEPIRKCANSMNLEGVPILAAAVLSDYWDMQHGNAERDAAVIALRTIVAERVGDDVFHELYPYSRHLLHVMVKSTDASLVIEIVNWVAKAQPVGGRRAVQRLERIYWVRERSNLYTRVRLCLDTLNVPGCCIAPRLLLLRASQRPADKELLRATVINVNTRSNELLRAGARTVDNPPPTTLID